MSNTEKTTAEKIKDIIADRLSVQLSEVTTEARFTDELSADSLDTVELIMEFEKEFNIKIADDDAEKIKTVGDAIRHVEEKVKTINN